ncbi:MAG: hypothetical protein K2X87_22735 [Gemmataceae bacterium]|nr:hypothetical protein [Gemmataceae bacterium]
MSTLGKVLLVINLLASAAFVYLATQDWAKGRQVIEAAGLRQVLLLRGLPLGERPDDLQTADLPADATAEVPFRVEMGGGRPTETVSPGVLKAYFAAGGGATTEATAPVVLTTNAPVANQLAEVRRVWGLIRGKATEVDGAAKAQVAGFFLRLQPETLDERVQVLGLIARGDGNAVLDRLQAKFDQVLNAPAAPDLAALGSADDDPAARLAKAAEVRGKTAKDGAERQARLAQLLVNLDPDPGWQKRVVLVVGIRQYVAALAAQAARFREMAARVERLTADDQARFADEYAQLRGLAIQQTQTVRDTAEVRARLDEQVRKDQEFVTQRQTQIVELRDQLTRVKADVDALLARQKVTEDALFAVQREVGQTLEQLYQLQEDLAKVERDRYGAVKK